MDSSGSGSDIQVDDAFDNPLASEVDRLSRKSSSPVKLPASPHSDGSPSLKKAGLDCSISVKADSVKTEPESSAGSEEQRDPSRVEKTEAKSSAIKLEPDPEKDAQAEKEAQAEKVAHAEREAHRLKKERQEEQRMKMQVLVSNFSEDQLDRYEMYRRAAFPKAAVRRLMQSICGATISQNVVIAMSGIAKVFVGEIVEQALDVMDQTSESGPVQPKHIREAMRRLRNKGTIVSTRYKKKLFR